MQKRIIVLAIAGMVSGTAFAQSNVTVYGVADVGMEVGKYSDKGIQTRVQSGQNYGSRIGFKGEEALGNGLKALFVMEAGISMDTGNTSHGGAGQATNYGPLFGRQAFAGIESSKFGAVTFGRQYTPAFYTLAMGDAFDLGLGANLANSLANVPLGGFRWDNAAMYKTPTVLGGLSATGAYTSGAANGAEAANYKADNNQKQTGRGASLGLSYAQGPVYVGGSYVNVDGATQDVETKGYQMSATYDFKVVKAFTSYVAGKTTASGGDTAKSNGWSLGARVPFGASTVIAQYSRYNDKLATNADYNLWGLGYEYALSKRTVLYTAYAKGDNKNAGTAGLDGAATSGATVQAGYSPWNVMTGMRHAF